MVEDYESERTATRDEAAALLRDLADGVGSGTLRFGRGDDAIAVDLPEEIDVEVELETEDGEPSVEVELEWTGSGGDDGPVAAGHATDAAVETEDSPVGPAAPSERLARFEVFRDRADEWRWRLVHRNGNVIATSGEGYTRKENAVKGLRSVVRNSPDADVTEESNP